MSKIIGRKNELDELERLYHSGRPEFVAVYGRRRVGKTFLIKQALKGRITFQHTGVSPVDQDGEKNLMRTQLESFYYTLLSHGLEGYAFECGTYDMAGLGPPCYSEKGSGCILIPIWSSKTGEGRNEIYASVIRHTCSQCFHFR